MSNFFPKAMRLRSRRDFQRMAYQCKRHVGNTIIVDVRDNQRQTTRLGITVSKRYGKAHDRNRFKRIVREAFRLARHSLIPGIDLNVRPRSNAYSAKTNDVMDEIVRFIGRR